MEKPISIAISVLQVLPPGRPLCIEETANMDGDVVTAIKWVWVDKSHGFSECRTAHFNFITGEYLGEAY